MLSALVTEATALWLPLSDSQTAGEGKKHASPSAKKDTLAFSTVFNGKLQFLNARIHSFIFYGDVKRCEGGYEKDGVGVEREREREKDGGR